MAYANYVRVRRPVVQKPQQSLESRLAPKGQNINAPIGHVAHEAPQVHPPGQLAHPCSKAYPLHMPADGGA